MVYRNPTVMAKLDIQNEGFKGRPGPTLSQAHTMGPVIMRKPNATIPRPIIAYAMSIGSQVTPSWPMKA